VPFPKRYAEFAARLRVPAGFLVAASFLWFAQPSWQSLGLGALVALAGLGLRAWAAGHLRKNQQLATSGPYAHVRNPLYVGSLIVAAGFGLAGSHLGVALALLAFFILVYLPVVEEEEGHIAKILEGFDDYRRRVPRFFPALTPQYAQPEAFDPSLYLKNREYEALIAFLIVMGVLAAKASNLV